MVSGLPQQSRTESASSRSDLQHGLESACESARTRQATRGRIQNSHHERADQLFDVSPLTDAMSDYLNEKELRILQSKPSGPHAGHHHHDHQGHDDHDEPAADLTEREYKLDLAAVREKLREN